METTTVTLDSVWASAKLLSSRDKNVLSKRINDTLDKKSTAERHQFLHNLKSIAGAWKDDPRSTEEILASIRALRTTNSITTL